MLIRPIHHEHELEIWKWLAIILLAVALSLALATAVGAPHAARPVAPPDPLAAGINV